MGLLNFTSKVTGNTENCKAHSRLKQTARYLFVSLFQGTFISGKYLLYLVIKIYLCHCFTGLVSQVVSELLKDLVISHYHGWSLAVFEVHFLSSFPEAFTLLHINFLELNKHIKQALSYVLAEF